MLTKLIGYEMKAFGRIILPLYAATIGMAIIMGLGIRVMDEEMYTNLLGAVIIMIFTSLIIATTVMTGILCVQRFYKNLLGNEGYLMFSLPVGTHQLIISKVLASLIWALLGGAAGVCTVAVMGFMIVPLQDTIDFFKRIGLYIRMASLGKNLWVIAVWFVILILAFVAALMQIYTAIAVGHQWSAHRILGSILAFFGIGIVNSIIDRIMDQIGYYTGWSIRFLELVGEDWMNAWQVQVSVIVSTLVLIAVYGIVTWYFLDKKLNLE